MGTKKMIMKRTIAKWLRALSIMMVAFGLTMFTVEMMKFMFSQNFYLGVATSAILSAWIPAVLSIMLEPTKKKDKPQVK